MTTTTCAISLHDNAHTLAVFLAEITPLVKDEADCSMHAVYLKDADGNYIDTAILERETLSDGSHVFNIVLKGLAR